MSIMQSVLETVVQFMPAGKKDPLTDNADFVGHADSAMKSIAVM